MSAADVSGDHAYLANTSAGVRIVEICDLGRLREVGAYDSDGTVMDVEVAGRTVYVADNRRGLEILDEVLRQP